MVFAPGFSVPVIPVWIPVEPLCVCVCVRLHSSVFVCQRHVALTFICSIFPRGWERSFGKWKHHFLRHMIFFPSFQAVSGLVFTGCFICLIYVPCPDCCMGPACSGHMAIPHALMRCPISRNTNRVLRPSLWLYDVWTHKSFPQIPGLHRSNSDGARGPPVHFLRGFVFGHLTHSWAIYQKKKKKEVAKVKPLERLFKNCSDSAFYFLEGNFTARQNWFRLHTEVVFVASYNKPIEHREVLEIISLL